VPGFREYGYGLYQALGQLGSRVLAALALHIGLPEQFFATRPTSATRSCGRSTIRRSPRPTFPTCAPARTRTSTSSPCWSGRALPAWKCCRKQGEWVPFTSDADTIVVNIGDMLQRLTNHVYPSTTHRVVNPPGEAARKPRYSVPFFLHPNPDYLIRTLPQCISADNPDRYPTPITSHEYLLERLREIKLI
jgi:isopenicillin N synthase-like dioxygenase